MTGAMLLLMLGFFALGVPIAVSIALAAILAIETYTTLPLLLVAQQFFAGLDRYPLLALPFFILAGNLMEAGGISERLIELARSIVGSVQGGLACSCVLTCMMFASVSGSSVATTFAVGSMMIPAMIRSGYPTPFAASVQACSAELGVIIPPSITMIIFGVTAEVSIGELFIAGIGPGLLIGCALMLWVHVWCRIRGYGAADRYDRPKFWPAARRASLGLLMSVVVLGGIYGGVFTPTEAAAVAVAYALVVGMLIYRRITPADFMRILEASARTSAIILLIIAAATLFNFLISRSGTPALVAAWIVAHVDSAILFLLGVNALLFVIGMFIETGAAIIVLAPMLTPIAIAYGIDPVHFGIIFTVNLAMGMFTPPFGVNLFAVSSLTGLPVERLVPSLVPFVLVVLSCLMLITYVPEISLGLRDLVYRAG